MSHNTTKPKELRTKVLTSVWLYASLRTDIDKVWLYYSQFGADLYCQAISDADLAVIACINDAPGKVASKKVYEARAALLKAGKLEKVTIKGFFGYRVVAPADAERDSKRLEVLNRVHGGLGTWVLPEDRAQKVVERDFPCVFKCKLPGYPCWHTEFPALAALDGVEMLSSFILWGKMCKGNKGLNALSIPADLRVTYLLTYAAARMAEQPTEIHKPLAWMTMLLKDLASGKGGLLSEELGAAFVAQADGIRACRRLEP